MDRTRRWREVRHWTRLAAALLLGAGLGGCEREPADLPGGHVSWLSGTGATRYELRAKPYGYRVLADASAPWGRIQRQPGEVRLSGPGGVVVARRDAEGMVTTDAAGEVRTRVRQVRGGLAVLDRAAAPLGRLALDGAVATASNGGGLPLGTVKESGGALVQRGREGGVVGSVLGPRDPLAAALLLLDDVPLADRLALLALRLERP